MGYAHPDQVSAGVHMRQFSRAFIIEDESTRVVFVSVDFGMIDQINKTEV
jgi:neutral ceramidase